MSHNKSKSRWVVLPGRQAGRAWANYFQTLWSIQDTRDSGRALYFHKGKRMDIFVRPSDEAFMAEFISSGKSLERLHYWLDFSVHFTPEQRERLAKVTKTTGIGTGLFIHDGISLRGVDREHYDLLKKCRTFKLSEVILTLIETKYDYYQEIGPNIVFKKRG